MTKLRTLGPQAYLRSALALIIAAGCSAQSGADSSPQPSGVGGGYGGGFSFGGNGVSNGGSAQLPPIPTCNNGVVDPGEECDGTTTQTCSTATMGARPLGVLTCNGCRLDTSQCTSSNPVGSGGGVGVGTGGSPVIGTGGSLNMGSGGTSSGAGGGSSAPPGKFNPVIPPVAGECPTWTNSTITFMGLGGVQIAAGPKAASATAPMLVYWHGTGSNSGEFQFMAAAVANGITSQGGVIVSFQNTTGGDLNSGTNIFGVGDLKLVDELVACAVRDQNIDPRKIYTMGCSAGGLFSAAMGAMRSQYVAAVAPNSGGWVVTPQWEDAHTPALMTVHGAPGSDVVVVDFSNTSATADTGYKNHGGFVMDCNTGGGHCGGSGLAGDVWKFFQAHSFGVDPEPYASGLPAGFSSQCQIK